MEGTLWLFPSIKHGRIQATHTRWALAEHRCVMVASSRAPEVVKKCALVTKEEKDPLM